jgi:hypothetical protein
MQWEDSRKPFGPLKYRILDFGIVSLFKCSHACSLKTFLRSP